MQVCKQCFVSGKVQGVFFRAATRERARTLQVTGYARNLDDGRVEVMACGEQAKVEELVAWLWQGSRASKVEAVEVHDVNVQAPEDFSTR